jgi:3-hydroxyisobutyrate dehydrogenase
VIGSGPLGSDVARAKLARMASRDFEPQASIRDVCKNAALVAAAAASAGVAATVLEPARRRFDSVLEKGGGALDMAAVVTESGVAGGPG